MKKRIEDRPIYIPHPRRILSVQKEVKEDAQIVELLGRYGRVNDYEFEFSTDEHAADVAASYERFGHFGSQGPPLVNHVEAPFDPAMSGRMIHSKVMHADLLENAEPAVRRQLLADHELLVPPCKAHTRWSSASRSASGFSLSTRNASSQSFPQARPPSTNNPFGAQDTDTTNKSQITPKSTTYLKGRKAAKVKTHKYSAPANSSQIQPASSAAELLNGTRVSAAISQPMSVESLTTVPFHAFENEMRRRFPSCFSRRLLIAMWVSLCRVDLCCSPKNGVQRSLPKLEQEEDVSVTTTNTTMTLEDTLVYFKGLLKEFLGATSADRSREASHCISYICIIIGDLCRYRDIHEAKQVQSNTKDGHLVSEETQKGSEKLFIDSTTWYDRASRHFPWESRTYTQQSDLYSRQHDILGQVTSTLRSIICAFRIHNVDALTVLLEIGSTATSSSPFVQKLLSLVQSLYCKISLDQFDTKMESLCALLKKQISGSITTSMLNTLLSAFVLLVLLMVETSSLWQEDARLGDRVDAMVKSIPLKLVQRENGTLEYQVDETTFNYDETALNLNNLYRDMTLTLANVFNKNLDTVADKIRNNERFALTCITFCRLLIVVIDALQSPLSFLLAVVNFAVVWLFSSGMLLLYNTDDSSSDSPGPYNQLKREIDTLKTKFMDLMAEYGYELLRVQQLKGELLQYTLPEDDYMVGCVDLPLEFCMDPKHQQSTHILSSSLVLPVNDDIKKRCCHVCYDRNTTYPCFVNINGLFEPDHPRCLNDPRKGSHDDGDEEGAPSLDGTLYDDEDEEERDALSRSSYSSVSASRDESLCLLQLNRKSTNSESNRTNKKNQLDVQCSSAVRLNTSRCGDNLKPASVEDSVSEELHTALDETERLWKCTDQQHCPSPVTQEMSQQDSTKERTGHGVPLEPSVDVGPQAETHYHVLASQPLLCNKSLVRLCRLLVLAGSLPEFRARCMLYASRSMMQEKDQGIEQEPDTGAGESDGIGGIHTHHSEDTAVAGKKVDHDKPPETRPGLLKVNHVILASDREGKNKNTTGRSRGKLTKPEAANTRRKAKSLLYSTGNRGTYRVVPIGNPRPLARGSSTKPGEPHVKQPLVSWCANKKEPLASPLPPFSLNASLPVNNDSNRILIVIDGSNVAHRHGGQAAKKFSSAGIKIVLDYYLSKNFNAIAFVPEYLTDFRGVGENRRLQEAKIKVDNASKIPDNVQLLRDLLSQGLLITTPAQDYDDSYIIQYAMNHKGYIVSNDRYRDQKDDAFKHIRAWLKVHLISFTFINDEFMPNPDFAFHPSDASKISELNSTERG